MLPGAMKAKLLALSAAALLLVSCGGNEKPGPTPAATPTPAEPAKEAEPEPLKEANVPAFAGDSAMAYVQAQVDFGPRVPNTEEHAACGDWLIAELERHGLTTLVQAAEVEAYTGDVLNIRNIMGRYQPENPNRIVLMAHWDTRPYADRDDSRKGKPILGANDGGSGVGVLLELARAVNAAEEKPTIGFDIVFFDAEDYGQPSVSMVAQQGNSWCLGSQYWSRNLPATDYRPQYGILLDMVGAADAVFPKEGGSMQYAAPVVNKVWATAERLGHNEYFVSTTTNSITDDHIYVNILAKIPTIDIVHYDPSTRDFGNFHHRHTDNMEIIAKEPMQAVGEVLLDVLYRE